MPDAASHGRRNWPPGTLNTTPHYCANLESYRSKDDKAYQRLRRQRDRITIAAASASGAAAPQPEAPVAESIRRLSMSSLWVLGN